MTLSDAGCLLARSWFLMFGMNPRLARHDADHRISVKSLRLEGYLAMYRFKEKWRVLVLDSGFLNEHYPSLSQRAEKPLDYPSVEEAIESLLTLESHRLAHWVVGKAGDSLSLPFAEVPEQYESEAQRFRPSTN